MLSNRSVSILCGSAGYTRAAFHTCIANHTGTWHCDRSGPRGRRALHRPDRRGLHVRAALPPCDENCAPSARSAQGAACDLVCLQHAAAAVAQISTGAMQLPAVWHSCPAGTPCQGTVADLYTHCHAGGPHRVQHAGAAADTLPAPLHDYRMQTVTTPSAPPPPRSAPRSTCWGRC